MAYHDDEVCSIYTQEERASAEHEMGRYIAERDWSWRSCKHIASVLMHRILDREECVEQGQSESNILMLDNIIDRLRSML